MAEVFVEGTEKQFLTPKEACDLLGCSRRSFEYWRRSAGLPVIKIGAFVRVERVALLNWFRQFCINREGGVNNGI